MEATGGGKVESYQSHSYWVSALVENSLHINIGGRVCFEESFRICRSVSSV